MAFGLFKKSKNSNLKLKIKEVIDIATDAVNLVFEKPANEFSYKPGQFITVIDEVNGEKVRRAYSLYTSPFLDPLPAVTVKRVESGKMSNHINDSYKAGMEVEIMEPMGQFTIDYNPNQSRRAIMIAGGSGITPLYALARTVLHQEPSSEVVLIDGNRSEDYIIFKNELESMQDQYGHRFTVTHILENNDGGYAALSGMPNAEMIKSILTDLNIGENEEFYICGPQPMMDLVIDVLKESGITDDRINIEVFGAPASSESEGSTDKGQSAVCILMDGETYEFEVPRSEFILENGLKQDIDMPYSCQSGLCTACRGKVLEGSVDTSDADGLTQSELDEGYALMCIGKPTSDKVVVEIG